MEGNSIDDLMRNISQEVDQSIPRTCSPQSDKKETKRPKKCPFDYVKVMNISKTTGWLGSDRLFMGYVWTGTMKMIFAVIALTFALQTMGNSLIILGIVWLMDLMLIYTGRLPPKKCYEDIALTKPGWRYLKDETSRSQKLKEEKGKKQTHDATFTIVAIIMLLGGAYAAS